MTQFVHKFDEPFSLDMVSTDPANVSDINVKGKFAVLTKDDMLNHDSSQSQIQRLDVAEEESKQRKDAELKAAETAKLRK